MFELPLESSMSWFFSSEIIYKNAFYALQEENIKKIPDDDIVVFCLVIDKVIKQIIPTTNNRSTCAFDFGYTLEQLLKQNEDFYLTEKFRTEYNEYSIIKSNEKEKEKEKDSEISQYLLHSNNTMYYLGPKIAKYEITIMNILAYHNSDIVMALEKSRNIFNLFITYTKKQRKYKGKKSIFIWKTEEKLLGLPTSDNKNLPNFVEYA